MKFREAVGAFETVFRKPSPEEEERRKNLKRAKSDAERAKQIIANHTKDIKIREKYRDALIRSDTIEQKRIEQKYASYFKGVKDAEKPRMRMADDELDLENNIFREAITDRQTDLLAALKNRRFAGDDGVNREILELEETLKAKCAELEQRKLKLEKPGGWGHESALGEAALNQEKAKELGKPIERIRHVLEMK